MKLILKNVSFSLLFRFAFVIVILSTAVWINTSNFSEGQQLKTAKSLGIKIISPTHNQTVPVGNGGLNILGTSIDTDVGNCYVSVIVNNIKPYQNATGSGPNGITDYSKWNFTFLPDKYTTIKEGQNKITSKLSCLNVNNNTNSNSTTTYTNLTKWYSVNITGVAMPSKANDTQTTTTAKIQQPVITTGHNDTKTTIYKRNNNTSSKILKGNNNEFITTQILPSTTSSAPPSTSKTNNNINNINKVKPLSISVQSSQNIVNGKGKSTITAIAYDATSGKKIDNAVVKLKITFTSNGTTKMISGYKGEATYSMDVKPDSNNNNNHGSSGNGSFTTTVQASAPGYTSASKTTTMAFSNSSSSTSSNSDINDLADNVMKDVKKKIIDSIFK
jgi:hypothetical protein